MTVIFYLLVSVSSTFSQSSTEQQWGTRYPAPDERDIIETKWKYTYAIHLESNTIIHQAEDYYDYYLHFRYDYTYDEYLNGRLIRGNWSLAGSELKYSFKNIKQFEIALLNKQKLVLEFTQPNSKGTYQYHFIRVETKDAPFKKPANELPDVIVETENQRKGKNWLGFNKRKKKKGSAKRKKLKRSLYTSVLS